MNADKLILVVAALPVIGWGQAGAPVEGVVTSSNTHLGLAGVGVSVEATTGRHVTYTTTTNEDGSFRIGSIDQDGEFKANFTKRGYRELPPESPALRPFRLAAATGTVRLQVELSPHAQLRGRVLDGDGHPATQVRIEISGAPGDWVMTQPIGKDGSFAYQNALPSSKFVLRAVPLKGLAPPRSTAEEPLVWAPTYYPDGTDRSQAAPIVWRGDVDLDGYEIKLRAVPLYRVRGVVLDDGGKPAAGASVKLTPGDGSLPVVLALDQPEAAAVAGPDGVFELPAVRPGEWLLAADWKRGNQVLSGFVSGRVSRGDWEDVRIKLEAPFTVKGTVEMPDAQAGRPLGLVVLAPADGPVASHDVTAPVGPDGRFEIAGVHRGRYRITTVGQQNDLYLDSVLFGGGNVLGQTVDIMDGSLPIRVIYKGNGGRVVGSVEHCGEIILVPKDAALQNDQFMRMALCDSAGHFEMGGFRPGDYYAAAYERRVELFDAALVAAMVANGESVKVEGGQSIMVTLKLTAFPEQ